MSSARDAKYQRALESETPEDRAVVPIVPPPGPDVIGVSLSNVQGDIFPTFPKKHEAFVFFTIQDATAFRGCLGAFTENWVTSSAQTIEYLQKIQRVRRDNIKNGTKVLANIPNQFNIALSRASFDILGIGNIKDKVFMAGPMVGGAEELGDAPASDAPPGKYVPGWEKYWMDASSPIHGVVVIASQDPHQFDEGIQLVEDSFKDTIKINFTLKGFVRKDELKGREFFGFQDGISQPAPKGLVLPHKGQLECPPGVLIHGLNGDLLKDERPKWALGGTIMAFRELQQDVSKFQEFCDQHPIDLEGDKGGVGSERRGARMFGRWKSGCPLDFEHIWKNDPKIGKDPELNNNFTYEGGQDVVSCPVTGHTRKMAPRSSRRLSPDELAGHLIMRGSIPYGPELPKPGQPAEQEGVNRGLLFASYQSDLAHGFKFIQERWANNVEFPRENDNIIGGTKEPGYDPIIGAAKGKDRHRFVKGEDIHNIDARLELPEDFITARGGEYFWVPSLEALEKIGKNEPLTA